MLKRALAALVVVGLMAMPAAAQNLAPGFSHGPTIPMFITSFDDNGNADTGMLDAGAMYALNWNIAPSQDETVRWVSLSLLISPTIPDAGDFRLGVGASIGVYNNLFSIGAVPDMVRTVDGVGTGALLGDFSKSNMRVVASLGFNFGSGAPDPTAALQRKPGQPIPPATPPPGYLGW